MKLPPYPLNLKPLPVNPLVSVIIGNYNYGEYLGAAIESVLQQTYSNLELIVVDDGSTDHSRQVMEAYGDRIVALYQQNGGQTAAFNTGINHAQGSIVCFLDADDIYHPEKVVKVVTAFQEHPEWVQISHYWTSINSEGRPLPHRQRSLSQGDVRALQLKYGKYKSALTSALAYRIEILAQIGSIPQRQSAADAYLMAIAPFYGAVGVLDEVLMQRRLHNSNDSSTINPEFHFSQREWLITHINRVAQELGIPHQFALHQDPDYLTFKVVEFGKYTEGNSWRILWLTLCQSLALKRSLKETVLRMLWGGVCVLTPEHGLEALEMGVTKYLRRKLLDRSSQNVVST
jgi:glycosyltransferase involved in cell wall biosynthesis